MSVYWLSLGTTMGSHNFQNEQKRAEVLNDVGEMIAQRITSGQIAMKYEMAAILIFDVDPQIIALVQEDLQGKFGHSVPCTEVTRKQLFRGAASTGEISA